MGKRASGWTIAGLGVAAALAVGGVVGVQAGSADNLGVPSVLVPIEPTRVLDTRLDAGLAGPFEHAEGRLLKVVGSIPVVEPGDEVSTGSPVPPNATAIVANLTAVFPSSPGFLAARPGTATGDPTTSSLNFTSGGVVVANSVTVGVPRSGARAGQIELWFQGTSVGQTSDVLVDVVGYYAPLPDIPDAVPQPAFSDQELGMRVWDSDGRSGFRGVSAPVGMAFDGDGVWATSTDSARISRIAGKFRTAGGIENVGDNPQRIAFDGTELWVTNFADDTVTRLEPDGPASETIAVGDSPVGVIADFNNLYVANSGDDTVTRIDHRTNSVLGTFDVGDRPYDVMLARSSLFVANRNDGTVTRHQPDGTPIETIPLGAGSQPFSLAHDRDHAWVTLLGSNAVVRIDMNTNTIDGSPIAVGGDDPRDIEFDGTNMWVTHDTGVTVIHVGTLATREIPVSDFPVGLAFDGDFMWVARFNGDDVLKFRP